MWLYKLSLQLPVVDLVGHYPTNHLIGRETIPKHQSFPPTPMQEQVISGISRRFQRLFQTSGQVPHVLLTRSPVSTHPKACFSLDLHVLGAPPAFVLSQDQTLH